MKIKDVEVDFDFFDAEDVERFEKEVFKVKEECEKKEKKEMPLSQAIREECKIIDDFFDKTFGEGTSQKLFNGKMNLNEHLRCYEDIIKAKIEQEKDLQSTFERYQPNREQRRNNKNFRG